MEKESDTTIISESKEAIRRAKDELIFQRKILEKYTSKNQRFLKSFEPIKVQTEFEIINLMAEAAKICDVGPMASVAGALADLMLTAMRKKDINFTPSKNSLVENGGEIVIDSQIPFKIGLYAGDNDLNFNLGFLIKRKDNPIGIGTSSSTIGHAISLGNADAVTVFADNATLADAAATKVANEVKGNDIEKSIKRGLDTTDDLIGVKGAFISRGDKIGRTGFIPQIIKLDYNTHFVKNERFSKIKAKDIQFFK